MGKAKLTMMWKRADDWLREHLPNLDFVEIHPELQYAWVWRFLIDWKTNVTIGYLPDYENAWFEVTVWPGKKQP